MAYIILLGAIALIIYGVCSKSGRRKGLERQIAALPNFAPAIRFERPGKSFALLLDPVSEQFAMAEPKAARCYGFVQLVAVEIERNGVSLEKVNRGSQIAGAVVAGALLGPVGVLLGGLTGPKRRADRVKRLALRLYTNDLHAPFCEVVFFEDKNGLPPDDKQVKQAALQLEEWYGRFRTILQANERAVSPQPSSPPTPGEATQPSSFGRRRGLIAQN